MISGDFYTERKVLTAQRSPHHTLDKVKFTLKLLISQRNSHQVEKNSGLNSILLEVVCIASRSPQRQPIQTITHFSPFGVFCLCTLDYDQQTPS